MKKYSHEEIQKMKPSISEVKAKKKNPIFVLLDNVRSLHNVGSFFRTSDAVNLDTIYLCGITGTPPKPEISKTALGAEEIVNWEYHDDAEELVMELKKQGVKIYAVELAKDAKNFHEFDFQYPCCFIFGHEVYGVSDDLMEACDDAVFIPMLGRANSLNVATSAGIILYEALKKIK